MITKNSNKIKVIIIGNGIAGLMLANCLSCLSKSNINNVPSIEFIILEKEETKKEYHGSDFYLHPNGIRALDQLGIWDKIKDKGVITDYIDYLDENNNKWATLDWKDNKKRYGYPIFSIIRQKLLFELWNNIENSDDKIMLNKKVISIKNEGDKKKVLCEDNTSYIGDFVVGADGARSKTRNIMYEDSGTEKEELKNKFEAIFGVSKPSNIELEKLRGRMQWHFKKDLSYFLHIQPNNEITWFLGSKLDENNNDTLNYKDIHLKDIKEEYKKLYTTHNCLFGDILDRNKVFVKVNLEECLFKKLYHEKIVLIGDAAHKILPFSGQGANMAIEDSVILTNILYKYLKDNNRNYNKMFEIYQEIREPRIKEIMDETHFTSNLINIPKWYHKYLSYVLFNMNKIDLYKNFIMDKRYRIRPILKFVEFNENNDTKYYIKPIECEYY